MKTMMALMMVWLERGSVAQLNQNHANHYARLHYTSDCTQAVVHNKVPLDPRVEIFDAHEVQQCLSSSSCMLVDVRDQDRESGTIAGAKHVRHLDIGKSAGSFAQKWAAKPLVVFHCQFSAHRAPWSANEYLKAARAGQRVAIMQGGFNEWKCMGLPVNTGPSICKLPGCNADKHALEAQVLGMAKPAAGHAGTPLNVHDNVVVWSNGNAIWYDDGRVVAVDQTKGTMTVQYNKNKLQKDVPLSSTSVHRFNGPLKTSDGVFVWSVGNNHWFLGKVVSINHRTGKLTVHYNNKMKEIDLWTSQVSKIPSF